MTTRTIALAAALMALHGAAAAQTGDGQGWRAQVFDGLAGGSPVCAAVLQDPADARIDAGIQWAFNSARAGELPDGYLSVHPDLRPAGSSLVVDGGRGIALEAGADGYLYSAPPVAFTLIGFTAAAEAARRACGG